MGFKNPDGIFFFGKKLDNKESNSKKDKPQWSVKDQEIQVQHAEFGAADGYMGI
jgi:hypothetical protein